VPIATPATVRGGPVMVGASAAADGSSSVRASPKSSTLTRPAGVILMFAGFRSRWTMRASCAAVSASAICRAIRIAPVAGSGPWAMRSASVFPSTSSITR
jgi:hypothetical protein